MPPRSKKSKKDAAAAAVPPPLPTEAPPLPDEAPPLPTEEVPPPLPTEAPPLPDEQPPLPEGEDEPITDLGGDDDDDESDNKANGDNQSKGKGKEKDKASDKGKEKAPDAGAWQAVWAPEQNAYYFWNKDTSEVTWENPLVSAASAAAAAPPLPNEPVPAASTSTAAPKRAAIPDIDPALHHLLGPEQRGDGAQLSALKFAPQDYNYSFTHLDEYNRAKRFSEHYFDVDGWEKQKAAEAYKRKADEEAGVGSSKKITKKDMDRFRAKKAEQKQRKQAWLYD